MSVTYAGLLQAPVYNLVNTILNVPPPVLVIVDREFQRVREDVAFLQEGLTHS